MTSWREDERSPFLLAESRHHIGIYAMIRNLTQYAGKSRGPLKCLLIVPLQ